MFFELVYNAGAGKLLKTKSFRSAVALLLAESGEYAWPRNTATLFEEQTALVVSSRKRYHYFRLF